MRILAQFPSEWRAGYHQIFLVLPMLINNEGPIGRRVSSLLWIKKVLKYTYGSPWNALI